MKQLYTIICVTAILWANAQSFDYKPLKAKGPIPEDFTQNYAQKVAEKQLEINKNASRSERKEDMQFLQFNEFALDVYLTSGNVIYGDEVTEYLNKVLDVILKDQPKLRSELRIYTVRSAQFNAYTTNNGIIFVNLGLISELETEAQLAYILCHEIVHYVEQHVRKDFSYKEDKKNERIRSTADAENLARNYYTFSKEHEFDADKDGYENYFDGLGYSDLAPFELMEIMLYAYLPFDEIPFDISCMAAQNFAIKDSSLLDFTPKEISAEEDVDATLSSHPNILDRKEALDDFVGMNEAGKDFLLSKELFLHIRNVCRYETVQLYLSSSEYDRAIYSAFLLQQSFPTDSILQRAIAYGVYGSSVYTNYRSFAKNSVGASKLEGQLSYVRHILKKIDVEELNTLAVALTYEYYKAHPQDEFGKKIFNDALWELTHYFEKRLRNYSATEITDSTEIKEEIERQESLKTGRKVKRLRKSRKSKSNTSMAFAPYMNDTLFVNAFKRMEDNFDEFKETLPLNLSGNKNERLTLKDVRNSHNNVYARPDGKTNVGGKGVKKAFIITPEYYSFNLKGSADIDYKKSSKRQDAYTASIKENAREQHITYEFFDYKSMPENDVDLFNEMQTLQRWYSEHEEHENINLIHNMYDQTRHITEKYDTKYMVYSGMINLNTKGTDPNYIIDLANFGGALIFYPLAPIIIGTYFIPSFYTFQFIHVVDLSNGTNIMYRTNEGRHYRTEAVTDMLLYEQFNELAKKPNYK